MRSETYTGEQALIDKNTNELWYSAQDGLIDKWVGTVLTKGDDITDVVTSNLPRFEAALKQPTAGCRFYSFV